MAQEMKLPTHARPYDQIRKLAVACFHASSCEDELRSLSARLRHRCARLDEQIDPLYRIESADEQKQERRGKLIAPERLPQSGVESEADTGGGILYDSTLATAVSDRFVLPTG